MICHEEQKDVKVTGPSEVVEEMKKAAEEFWENLK